MTSRLTHLRTQLSALRRARGRVRAVAAWAALASAVLLALVGIFFLDMLFSLAVPQRIVVLALAAVAVGWAYWRFTRPLLAIRENEIDTALIVERQHRLSSELVAALQFEQPSASRWGSPQLTSQVVEQVAFVSPRINVFAGFSRGQLVRRLSLLAACVVFIVVLAVLWPAHGFAFANRLFLGSMHYPTRTRIEQILVNRLPVLVPGAAGQTPQDANAAQGRPVNFLVQCRGVLPGRGAVHLASTAANQQRTRIELTPLTLSERQARLATAERLLAEAAHSAAVAISAPWRDEVAALLRFDAPAAAQLLSVAKTHADLPPIARRASAAAAALPANHSESAVLSGELGRLNDNVTYRLTAGDAWTDPALLKMIPLPVIEVRLNPVPPKYARAPTEKKPAASAQLAVLEGSSVELEVACVNAKPLASAWLTLQTAQSIARIELAASDASRTAWTLPATAAPLRNLREELRYEVQVIDADGLSLESPIRGTIRIRPDLPPTAVADVVHRVVLPTAAPVIAYRASDDFGLARLTLVAEIERPGARAAAPVAPADAPPDASPAAESPAAAIPPEMQRVDVLRLGEPLTAGRLPVTGQYSLALAPLKLAKGDRVKLTLEATDYRGENEQGAPTGVVQASDPLVLEISDESGVLAAIAEADPRTEEQLNEIIKRQLGIGEDAKP